MPLAYIPSPPGSDIGIGPLKLHVYGALIVAGVVAAVWVADRRWRARGGEAGTFSAIAMWAVPGGLIGARLYHVVTDYELYTHDPLGALEIWKGGLGIWGGIAGGVLAGWIYIRRHGLDFGAILDCVAPALPLAQAIGRWGNYFNQELFGRPTTLPWGLKVAPDKVVAALGSHPVPPAYAHAAAFQPTFLYESVWDLIVVALVLLVERRARGRLRKGYLFAVYVSLYTFGRFFTEYLRIDFAHKILGLRLNDWTSIIIFVVTTFVLLRKGVVRGQPSTERQDADSELQPAGVPVAGAEGGSTLSTTDLQGEIRPSSVPDPGTGDSLVDEPVPPVSTPEPAQPDVPPAAPDASGAPVEPTVAAPADPPTSGSGSSPAGQTAEESPPH
jgi:prolipoprotein diacylglyceryl transferase